MIRTVQWMESIVAERLIMSSSDWGSLQLETSHWVAESEAAKVSKF